MGSVDGALTADMDEVRPEAAAVLPAGETAAQAASSIIEDGGPTPEKGSGWRISVHEPRTTVLQAQRAQKGQGHAARRRGGKGSAREGWERSERGL